MDKIYLISGKSGSGKSEFAKTASDILSARGKKVLVAAFGDLVKHVARTFFGWDGKKNEAGRALLQKIGTDEVRGHYKKFWAVYLAALIDIFQDEWDYIFVHDVRYKNEIEVMQEFLPQRVITIRVDRNITNSLTEEQRNHSSETELDNYWWDYNFENNRKLKDFKTKITEFINKTIPAGGV